LLLPEAVETLPHVRERFFDPAEHTAPSELDEMLADAGVALTLEEILRQGGPLLARLVEWLSTANEQASATAGARFSRFPRDLKRPVEVLGVLHLLSRIGALDTAEDRELVITLRPDGTERTLRIPAVTLTAERARLVAELELT
jgi:hypothetical protein